MAFERIKTVKGHRYRYLVENVRTGKKVHQKIIQYLGKVTEDDNGAVEVLDVSQAASVSKRERQNLAKIKSAISKIEALREREQSYITEIEALLRKRYPSCAPNEKPAKRALKYELIYGDIQIAKAMVNTSKLVWIHSW